MTFEKIAKESLFSDQFVHRNDLNFVSNQFDMLFTHAITGQEDCLVLSVYVPGNVDSPKEGLPVMVFIHGGAFFVGSGSKDFYGPERFLDHDVVRF